MESLRPNSLPDRKTPISDASPVRVPGDEDINTQPAGELHQRVVVTSAPLRTLDIMSSGAEALAPLGPHPRAPLDAHEQRPP